MEDDEIINMVEDALCNHHFLIVVILSDGIKIIQYMIKNQ